MSRFKKTFLRMNVGNGLYKNDTVFIDSIIAIFYKITIKFCTTINKKKKIFIKKKWYCIIIIIGNPMEVLL